MPSSQLQSRRNRKAYSNVDKSSEHRYATAFQLVATVITDRALLHQRNRVSKQKSTLVNQQHHSKQKAKQNTKGVHLLWLPLVEERLLRLLRRVLAVRWQKRQ